MATKDDVRSFNLYETMKVPAPSALRPPAGGADAFRTHDAKSNRRFRYTAAQRFVAHRVVHDKSTRGMLAWHGIGTGKTCTGVLAAFAFLRRYPEGCVHVIAPTNAILGNWNSSFYNDKPLAEQCATSRDFVPKIFSHEDGVRNIDQIRLYSLQSFQNLFTPKMISKNTTGTYLSNLNISKHDFKDIPEYLNGFAGGKHLFIVDEIHMNGFIPMDDASDKQPAEWQWAAGTVSSIRKKAAKYKKKKGHTLHKEFKFPVSFILGIIGQTSPHTRMLLLTATPAYDNRMRVYGVVSMLRAFHRTAEGRGRDDYKAILTHNGKTWVSDLDALRTAAVGYVSYVRGNDPHFFPVRLSHGDTTATAGKLYTDELYRSFVSGAQFEHIIAKKTGKWEASEKVTFFTSSRVPNAGGATPAVTLENAEQLAPKFAAIERLMRVGMQPGSMKQAGRDGGSYRCPKPPPNRTPGSQTAPDTAAVAGTAPGAGRGIILVAFSYNISTERFSEFLVSCGYKRVDKTETIDDHRDDYMAFTTLGSGSGSNTTDLTNLLEAVNDGDNWDGRRIRVVVAMPRYLTGVDFKNVRQVHLVETWWNTGRNEQAIGRAFRRNSHTAFAPSNRNVTVHQHALVYTPAQQKRIDESRAGTSATRDELHIFKRAAAKAKASAAVLSVLREAAADCSLQLLRTNDDYALAQRNAYPTIIDVCGKSRRPSPRRRWGQVKCVAAPPTETIDAPRWGGETKADAKAEAKAERKFQSKLEFVVEDVIDVASGVFRVFDAVAADQIVPHIKMLAQSAVLGRHAAVQFYPEQVIRRAIDKLVGSRIPVVAPSGRAGTVVLIDGYYSTRSFRNKRDVATAHTTATRAVRDMDWILYRDSFDGSGSNAGRPSWANTIQSMKIRTDDLWSRCKPLWKACKTDARRARLLKACVEYVSRRLSAKSQGQVVTWAHSVEASDPDAAQTELMGAIRNYYVELTQSGRPFEVYTSTRAADASKIRYMWDVRHRMIIEIATVPNSGQLFVPPRLGAGGETRSVAFVKYPTVGSNAMPGLVLRTLGNPGTNGLLMSTKRDHWGAVDFVDRYIDLFGDTKNRNPKAVEVAICAGFFDSVVVFYTRDMTYR